MLAAQRGGLQPRLATVLRSWTLGLHQLRLVLVFGLFVGLGAVSLWPLVSAPAHGLVLDAGHRLGSVVGDLAVFEWLLRLGAASARSQRTRPASGFFYRGTSVSVGFNWGLSPNCFTFVPTQHFCDPHPRRHCVAPAQVTQIFNQTTVINNFNGQGRNLANRGIDPEHISTVTRVPIRPVAIRDIILAVRTWPAWRSTQSRWQHADCEPPDATLVFGSKSSLPPAVNRPLPPVQPVRQTAIPVVTTHGLQDGNAIRIPPQHPSSPASYYYSPAPAPTAPNHDNRTYSPRGWEQEPSPQPPRANTYHPERRRRHRLPTPGREPAHTAPAPGPTTTTAKPAVISAKIVKPEPVSKRPGNNVRSQSWVTVQVTVPRH